MSGMDQFSDIPPWVSAISAAFSALFAGLSLYQSKGSKKAKAEAEKQAQQAEESLKQMQQIAAEQQSQSQSQAKIAASLQGPPFELTSDSGNPVQYSYRLRNTTKEALEIKEIVNCKSFIERDSKWYEWNHIWNGDLPWKVYPDQSIRIFLPHGPSVSNLELKVEGKDDSIFITIPPTA